MFTKNKYYRWYDNIIITAKSRDLLLNQYYEKHHIVPKSLGGNNTIDNLVSLTAKEHFICHLLLTKFTGGKNRQKMAHASWRMCHPRKNKSVYIPSSRLYNIAREKHAEAVSLLKGENHPLFGRKTGRTSDSFTKEWKENLSKSKIGQPSANKGIPRTQKVKDAVSRANKNKTPWNKNKKWDDVTISKIREGNTGKRWVHDNNGTKKYVDLNMFNQLLSDGWSEGIGNRKKHL